MTRTKSALIIFVGLAIAAFVAVSFDYTDTYVADRFHKALAAEQYEVGAPFSLDAFLQYYDWDEVCVALPYSAHEFKTRFGLSYAHGATDDSHWSLIFIKEGAVVAEIVILRSFIEAPLDLEKPCFDRWSGIVTLDKNEGTGTAGLRMSFVGG